MDNEQILQRLNSAFGAKCEKIYDQTWEEFRKAGRRNDEEFANRVAEDRWSSLWSSIPGVEDAGLDEWGPNAFRQDGEVIEGDFVIKNPGGGPMPPGFRRRVFWLAMSQETALKILVMGLPETNESLE
jgi:hypothetical protein